MDKEQLVQMITSQVMKKISSDSALSCPCPSKASGSCSGTSCSTGGGCSGGSCPPAWDGVGTVGDMLQAGASRVSSFPPLGSCPDPGLARLIDHTLLKPEATESEIRSLCSEAAQHCFMSVCVNPAWVPLAAKLLRNTGVKVCTVVGFPLGATFSRVKELETRVAIDEGADEIDMVINVGALKSGNLKLVENDIYSVVRAARGDIITKVILEVCLLTDQEIVDACKLCEKAGAHFVKTSTGFAKGGATTKTVALMRKTVGSDMGVKASGGVRDHETAMNMIGAGASRIGASASVEIISCGKPSAKGY